MDLTERIERRQMRTRNGGILLDRSFLSPTLHLEEPVDRARTLESLLDAIEPIFEGRRPPELVVEGPAGVGKSAVVDAIFGVLAERVGAAGTIATSTRGGQPRRWFATIDCRRATTDFRFYRRLLAQLGADEVPEHGVGTDALRERVVERLSGLGRWALVAVDHVEEAGELDVGDVEALLEPFADSVSVTWIGRSPSVDADRTVRIEPYRRHALVDVLSQRAARALRTDAFDHEHLREIAQRREGNAHDALAVLLGAALVAEHDGVEVIERPHLEAAEAAVPRDTTHLGAVLALPENRRRVLAELLRLEPEPTVAAAAESIAARTALSEGSVRRFCYELADAGVLARRRGDVDAPGRNPSHLRPAFPWLAFAGLDDVLDVGDVLDRLQRDAPSVAAE